MAKQVPVDLNRQRWGWFVGWVEKDDCKITFAYYIEDQEKPGIS